MKKIDILSLILFSLMLFSSISIAGERRGAEIIVQKKDGLQVRGELIAVKENSLLLLTTDGNQPQPDVSIDVGEIREVKIIKPSKVLKGMGYGLVIGAVTGAIAGAIAGYLLQDMLSNVSSQLFPGEPISGSAPDLTGPGAIGGGIMGTIIGLISGRIASGADEILAIENRAEGEIREALLKLSAQARIQNIQ